jgi:hypothetical protein
VRSWAYGVRVDASDASRPRPRYDELLRRGSTSVLVAVSVIVLVSVALAAVGHVDDDYVVDHPAGTWIALARYANGGTLYPPLYDGVAFGGTRYMPVPILLQAGVERLTGSYVTAGKAISLVALAALLVMIFLLLRRLGCAWPVALALTSSVPITATGVVASTGIRHDVLPVVLQLGALALATRVERPRAVTAAGVLCALAVAAKLSAVWAPPAIALWLLFQNRRALLRFVGSFAVALGALFSLFELLSSGRLGTNIAALGLSGSRREQSLSGALDRYLTILHDGLGIARLLLALAAIGVVVALWRRRLTIYHVAYVSALVVLVPVLSDFGTYGNQVVDAYVLAVVVVGILWVDARALTARAGILQLVLVASVLLVAVVSYRDSFGELDLGAAARQLVGGREPPQMRALLAGHIRPGDRIVSENPYVADILGERPIVLDPYELQHLASTHPGWRDDFVRRLDAHEFDAIFLLYRPERWKRYWSVRFWYTRIHFGPEITAAIIRDYRETGRAAGMWIYRPRPAVAQGYRRGS